MHCVAGINSLYNYCTLNELWRTALVKLMKYEYTQRQVGLFIPVIKFHNKCVSFLGKDSPG